MHKRMAKTGKKKLSKQRRESYSKKPNAELRLHRILYWKEGKKEERVPTGKGGEMLVLSALGNAITIYEEESRGLRKASFAYSRRSAIAPKRKMHQKKRGSFSRSTFDKESLLRLSCARRKGHTTRGKQNSSGDFVAGFLGRTVHYSVVCMHGIEGEALSEAKACAELALAPGVFPDGAGFEMRVLPQQG